MLGASNNPIMTWGGYQVSLMKFTTRQNVSTPIMDI
jgi:hypothetical protein